MYNSDDLNYDLLARMMDEDVLGYSLRSEILVGEMDVSRRILVLDASIFIHFYEKYIRTEGVQVTVDNEGM